MLKKICGLFLGLVVCAGSACVTPTHASSADSDFGFVQDMLITRIQASGEFGAKDEYIVLHNNSDVEINLTDWCLINKSDVLFVCFANRYDNIIEGFYVPPYGDAVAVSREYANTHTALSSAYTIIYDVTNQSSGSIVNSADEIVLLDGGGGVIDMKFWDTAIPTGKIHARVLLLSGPNIYADTNSSSDWVIENRSSPPISSVDIIPFEIPNSDPEENPSPEPINPPAEVSTQHLPIITEILPNPAGSDAGAEFIELYNPNEQSVILLDNYTLLVGAGVPKSHNFPAGASIPPLSYVAFSNQEIDYTLVNTLGRVQLAKGGEAIGEVVEYMSPKDDFSWSFIEGVWQYTKSATPGIVNNLQVVTNEAEPSKEPVPVKPCAVNQFRNPETGRCKLIGNSQSAPAPCKENQERNPETNRCRNIVAAVAPTPCKEGQERNPETNRCRAIVKMSKVEHGLDIQSKTDTVMSWYYWAAIVVILLLVIGYAVWEWRVELGAIWTRLRATFAKHSD